MAIFDRKSSSVNYLPDRYTPGEYYNCFLETVEPELKQAVYEELKRNNAICSTGEYTSQGIQLSVKGSLSTLLDAYNAVAKDKKVVSAIEKKRLIQLMLENPNVEATYIMKTGKKRYHVENFRFCDFILASEEQFIKGNKNLEAKEYKKAVDCYNKAIKIEPLDARAWNNKGYVLFTLGKYNEAIKSFDKALEIAPGMLGGMVWSIKADALKALGKNNEALECYDKALEKINSTKR